ncbi:delta(1)-pyrroline-2-carboxylate reductase family protein [Paenalcaligenes niemegkensis]|uniref:delta(1)-pyrroline-2-carboxylate reductase family protein n=1 Tax=Paenalcaligenes niemegkensis TaxID=2895469 RepID=UPI001EE97136|nr:delta(1)-pyrroline-2-carboxylate reductase family protein [Paenalcaligenes niemegkensis]MCQ9615357.1 delta(1)-pyrroline-2-carboxylate reductase family protein [Paenalcaligenes niemegkensis]
MHNLPLLLDAEQTAAALAFPALVESLTIAASDYASQAILAPTRQALSYPNGATMLSMPATAKDIGIHKLVNIMPDNHKQNLAVIQGLVCAYDGQTGAALFVLDGPTVTERRTAAVSMLGIRALWNDSCKHVAIIGAGVQAIGHARAVHALYPDAHITLVARNSAKGKQAAESVGDCDIQVSTTVPAGADVVICATSSSTPVYHEAPGPGRLVIGMGAYRQDMAEIAPGVIHGSRLYIDDPESGPHEAGDFLQAHASWDEVHSIAHALRFPPPLDAAMVYKTVGCAAWDLAAARCARLSLGLS